MAAGNWHCPGGFWRGRTKCSPELVFSLSRSELFRVNPEMKQADATRPASAMPAFLLTITNRNDPLSDLVQIENVQTGEVIYSGTINHQNEVWRALNRSLGS